jgi:hypothetical protein
VLQPWAGLIAAGVKTVEFRSQPTRKVGERVAIRSGAAIIEGPNVNAGWELLFDRDLPYNHINSILAVATIAECRGPRNSDREQPGWMEPGPHGDYGYSWVLSDVQTLSEPLEWKPKRGAQTWAILPPEVAAEVERQEGDS